MSIDALTREKLLNLSKLVPNLNELFSKKLPKDQLILQMHQLIGIETLEEIQQLFLTKDFILYGLQTIQYTKGKYDYWEMFAEFKIFPYLFFYFYQINSISVENDWDYTYFKLQIASKYWRNIDALLQVAEMTEAWPQDFISDEQFFGNFGIDLREDNYLYLEPLYEEKVALVVNTPNSSAIFQVYDNEDEELVCVVNTNGQTKLLLSSSKTIHPPTKNLIKKYNLDVVECKETMKVVHDGDCNFYSTMAINTIAALARKEQSVIKVLTELENSLQLSDYYPSFTNIASIDHTRVQASPDPVTFNRILLKIKTSMQYIPDFNVVFKELLQENGIDFEGFIKESLRVSPEAYLEIKDITAYETVFQKTLLPLNQYLAEIAQKFSPNLSELDFIALIETKIGMKTLETIKELFSHKLFTLYGLQTIRFINDQWNMYYDYSILPYLFYYFQSKSLDFDDDFFKINPKQLAKLTLNVIPKHWADCNSPFFQSARAIFDSSDFPINPQEKFLGVYFIDLREPANKDEFLQLVKKITEEPNTSAIFHVANGTFVEPVCVFNYQKNASVLLSNSHYIHDFTKNLIKKYKLDSVHSTNINLKHDGDCDYYSMIALNTILSVARADGSMLSVLIQLQENKLDLTRYSIELTHFKGIDCNSTKPIPDTRTVNRILQRTRDALTATHFSDGFFQLLEENAINANNFTILQQKINSTEKIDAAFAKVLDNPDQSKLIEENNKSDEVDSNVKRSLINQQDQEISAILEDFSKEISSIKKPHVAKAIEKAKHLLISLIEAKQTYLIKLNNPDNDRLKAALEFKNACTKLIQNTLPILQKELGWGDYLKNMLKKLANTVISIFSSNQRFFKYKESALNNVAKTTKDKLNNLKLT